MNNTVHAFAPGRIEFLGNHLDYNGGTVLGTAINAGIYAVAQMENEPTFHLRSKSFEGSVISGSIEKLEKLSGDQSWGNYCLGVLKVLQDKNLAPTQGFSLTLRTDLPMSAGLSSSAAVELATAQCLLALSKQSLPKEELVNICRQAENEWVGLPCGILDQGTSAFGETNRVVQIDCAKESYSTLPFPLGTSFWIFDTGIKHDLIDSHYGTRNQECKDALTIIQALDGSIECLTQCPVSLLQNIEIPENLKKRALHVVEEQARVHRFSDGLQNKSLPLELGPLLTASHKSSSLNFENSLPELDFLVEELRKEEKVFGARLTGGGFGGAVLAWTSQDFSQADANLIALEYENEWKHKPNYHSFLPSKGACLLDHSDVKLVN